MSSFRKDSAEDDEYWEGSKMKNQRVNLFDDDLSVETAENLARSKKLLQDDDDDIESINWDGSSVESIKNRSTLSLAENDFSSPPHPPISATLSGPSKPAVPAYLTHTRSQSHTFGMSGGNISFEPSRGAISYSKSSERVNEPYMSVASVRSNISLEEGIASTVKTDNKTPQKMSEEIEMLKRLLQRTKENPPVEDTIRNIVLGKPYNLECYRSLDDKLALLNRAIAAHDGNAIIATVLFLKRTVKPSIFNLEIQKRPAAINHYISFLNIQQNYRELENILGMLNRQDEAAMLKYKQAVAINDVGSKISALKSCLRAHFQSEPSLSNETRMVQEHISILERQRPIEDADSAAEREGRTAMFKQHPRVASILNMPVITTLYYCCYYHPGLQENHLASPLAIRKEHNLSEKQFVWTALSARSRLKQWNGVEELLTTKGWFGGTKSRAVIGFDRVCEVLNKTGAPRDAPNTFQDTLGKIEQFRLLSSMERIKEALQVLTKYLNLIDNTERRLQVAKKLKCHNVVVDTCVALKDRAQITEYARKLPITSSDYSYAQNALKSSTIKWKN